MYVLAAYGKSALVWYFRESFPQFLGLLQQKVAVIKVNSVLGNSKLITMQLP